MQLNLGLDFYKKVQYGKTDKTYFLIQAFYTQQIIISMSFTV